MNPPTSDSPITTTDRSAGTAPAISRIVLGAVLPAVTLALGYLPYVALRSDLPTRLATHFDATGTPDDSMTPAAFVAVTSLLIVPGIIALVALAARQRPFTSNVASIASFGAAFVAGLGAGILGSTVVSQRNNVEWTDAGSPWLAIASALVLAVTLGVIAARVTLRLSAISPPEADAVNQPVMDLGSAESAVWSTRLHSTWLSMTGIALMSVGLVIAAGTKWWLVFPALLSGLALLSLATLHVWADRAGLHIKYGALPWPRTDVPVEQIETATVIDVRPMEWGGWGYRGSLKLMNQAAVVHRSGPGLRLDLTNGKVFAVTVDDPETPVSLLNAEVHRRRETLPA